MCTCDETAESMNDFPHPFQINVPPPEKTKWNGHVIESAVYHLQGRREDMEDTHTVNVFHEL